ncbi:putative DnaJ like protein subfamily C member 21 [Amylocarpus encephaloides]|uniref:DnaJ like protein subfamily C member 21 n=1 Tax=Amylocarpus encephaloides TaxID=45428 RepID=A0A9P8C1C4_9HELO|nr:putative DnaJ like protein subfamily C member 21 [Amylocarpus encephaloides]
MGAQQSSPGTGSQPGGINGFSPEQKRCYYEVLGVDSHATEDDIKKAYRKKALELHPDRNYGDVENATVKFAIVQSAYQVLSDVQERAWYDSHRESILRGDGGGEEHFEHSVRLTSAGDIVKLISRFNPNMPFTDAPNGFYGILQDTFGKLAEEENSACDWEGLEPVQFPWFGGASDNYEHVAKPFYRVWMNFSTNKTFSWRDAYRTSDGPDRATRRLIEKENKRLRDEGIREFNDAVRSLVVFVRKRDPRFIPNSQSEADRQKILRDAVAAQAAKSRAANQAKLQDHVLPAWAQSSMPGEEEEGSSEEVEEVDHIECVVCRKVFKSEKQYETHEKSKKHIKAVQQLRREMKKENKRLNLNESAPSSIPSSPLPELENLDLDSQEGGGATTRSKVSLQENLKSGIYDHRLKLAGADELGLSSPEEGSSIIDDEYGLREDVKGRLDPLAERVNSTSDVLLCSLPSAQVESSPKIPKLNKAKAKRAKKAAREAIEEQEEQGFKCATCGDSFPSKNMLFSHIKECNHAQPVSKAKGINKSR